MNPIFWRTYEAGVVLIVRVTPKAARSQIGGVVDGALKITLHAPPAGGRANAELIHLLSKTFAIPKSRIEILSGETARIKHVLLRGSKEEEIAAKLENMISL